MRARRVANCWRLSRLSIFRSGRSRPQRWNDALTEMLAVQVECAALFDALPESLHDGATAMALQAIIDVDLDALAEIEPPRGYGRD